MGTTWPARARRIAVMSDIHANLPALEAALADIRKEGVDGIVHTGDVIGFGPQPTECLDLVLATRGMEPLMGNHELWCLRGDAGPGKPAEAVSHLDWTWKQVSSAHRKAMAEWPFHIERDIDGVPAAFQHYALDPSGRDFLPIERPPSASTYDRLFGTASAAILFFGHDHAASATPGRTFYADPGSLGTGREPAARWLLVRFGSGKFDIERRAAPYNREPLWKAFEERKVPGRAHVIEKFYRTQEP